jgi:hypothetical protein
MLNQPKLGHEALHFAERSQPGPMPRVSNSAASRRLRSVAPPGQAEKNRTEHSIWRPFDISRAALETAGHRSRVWIRRSGGFFPASGNHIPIVLLALPAAVVIVVLCFDFGPLLAANDDFVYGWASNHLATNHELAVLPSQTPAALPQIVWGVVVSLGNTDYQWLRLATLPFLALAGVGCYQTARVLGTTRSWALVGALCVTCNPISLSLATSYMTDIYFLGLEMATVAAGVMWLQNRRAGLALVLLAGLATLQRQIGFAVPLALTLALLTMELPRSRVGWRELRVQGALWAATAGALVAPPHVIQGFGGRSAIDAASALSMSDTLSALGTTLAVAAPMLGLLVIPLALAMVGSVRESSRTRLLLLSLPVAIVATVLSISTLNSIDSVFPGDYLSRFGLGPPQVPGVVGNYAGTTLAGVVTSKPVLVTGPVFAMVETLCVGAFVVATVALARRRAQSSPPGRGSVVLFPLLLAACLAMLTALHVYVLDRYYLVIFAPIVPLLAYQASRSPWPRLAMAGAYAGLVLFLAAYVIGEQDYQAWQSARDETAHLAYAQASALQVDAGYEANGVYGSLPIFDLSRQLPFYTAPSGAKFHLEFAPADDPRPGVTYHSLGSGRIVIVPGPGGSG